MDYRKRIVIPMATGLLLVTLSGCAWPAALTPAKALYKRYTKAMETSTQYNYTMNVSVETSEDGITQISDLLTDTDAVQNYNFSIEAEGTYNGDDEIATMNLDIRDSNSLLQLNEDGIAGEADNDADGNTETADASDSTKSTENLSETKSVINYSINNILLSGEAVYLRDTDQNFENISKAYGADVAYPEDLDTTAVITIPEDYAKLLWSGEERNNTELDQAGEQTLDSIDKKFSKEKKVPTLLIQNTDPAGTESTFFNALEETDGVYDWLNIMIGNLESATLDPDTQNQLAKIANADQDGSLSYYSNGDILLDEKICEQDEGAMIDAESLELLADAGSFINGLDSIAALKGEAERTEKEDELKQKTTDYEIVYQYQSSIKKISKTQYLKKSTLTICTMHNSSYAIPIYTITCTFTMSELDTGDADLTIPTSGMDSPDLFASLLQAFYKEPLQEPTLANDEKDGSDTESFTPCLEIGETSSNVTATSSDGTFVAVGFDDATVYMLKNVYDENKVATVNISRNTNDEENNRWEVVSGIQGTLTVDNADLISMSHEFYEYPLDSGYVGQYDSSENMLNTMTADIQYISQAGGIDEREVKFANGWNYKVTVAVTSTSAEMYCLRVDNDNCVELIHIMTTDSQYLKELMDMLTPDATEAADFTSDYVAPEATPEETVVPSATPSPSTANVTTPTQTTGGNNTSSGNSGNGTNSDNSGNNQTISDTTPAVSPSPSQSPSSSTTPSGNTGDAGDSDSGGDTDSQKTEPSPSPSPTVDKTGWGLELCTIDDHTMYKAKTANSQTTEEETDEEYGFTRRMLQTTATVNSESITVTDENYEFTGSYTSKWNSTNENGGAQNQVLDEYVEDIRKDADEKKITQTDTQQTGTYWYRTVTYSINSTAHSETIFVKVGDFDGGSHNEVNVIMVELPKDSTQLEYIIEQLSLR